MHAPRNSYTFKEGLTMMAAKAIGIDPYMAAEAGENARAAINAIRNAAKTKQPKDRAEYIREAQNELRTISAAQHPKLVNALQAKLLALQGRGGETEVAHVAPGEMVIPRAMLTPEVMELIASEAQRRGIDPRRLMVGGQGSINPATGAEEFGVQEWISKVGEKIGGFFKPQPEIDPITVTTRRQDSKLYPSIPDVHPIPNVHPTEKPQSDMRFYKPWNETPENQKFLQAQSDQFAKATNRGDYNAMQKIYTDTQKKIIPSGMDLKRDPKFAQEKEDFTLMQNVRIDAHKKAEPVTDSSVLTAWQRNRSLDPLNHFIGADGKVYWRRSDLERAAVSPYALPQSWEQPLLGAGFLDAIKRKDRRRATRIAAEIGVDEPPM
jgi:hypothetical protein